MKALSNCFIVLALLSGIGLCEAQQAASSQSSIPAPTPYSIVENDANSRAWERTIYEQGPNGQSMPQMQRFTELASGLNYQDPTTGQWVPSKEEIDIQPDGTAVATNGQHQVYFPSDIYDGRIELVTPDGKQLFSQPAGLSYDDGTNTVLIAVLTNSVLELLSSNQVIYPNAFAGVTADLLYTYTKAGFEQDIILHEQPPSSATIGLNPATTRLQVLTEFFNSPQPTVITRSLPEQAGATLTDQTLDFGTIQMVPGRAFLLGANAEDRAVVVGKQWLPLNGRQFLVEEVPMEALANQLEQLPSWQVTSRKPNPPLNVVSSKRLLPNQRWGATQSKQLMHIAKAALPAHGLVLDYNMVNSSLTNYTFQGDTTYYISGATYLFGTNTFEGGCVIKYTNGASINVSSALNWQASSYRPVIFTAKDDDTVGQQLPGSTGNPTNYYANPALLLSSGYSGLTLSNFRIAYAQLGISIPFVSGTPTFYNVQFVDSSNALSATYGTVYLRNILFAGEQVDFGDLENIELDIQNATFGPSLLVSTNAATLECDNCIFADVGRYFPVGLNGNCNGFIGGTGVFGSNYITSSLYPFQVVGGGSYYLTNGCAFRGVGTTNIDPVLLTELAKKTTYPPIVYSNANISTLVTLNPQVQRDTNSSPDLGYHYDPLDYAFGGCSLSTNLQITAGTAIGLYGIYGLAAGILLNNGADFTATGTTTASCWIAFANSAQEGCNGQWIDSQREPAFEFNGSGSGDPQLNTTFTKMFDGAWQNAIITDSHFGECNFKNSEFWMGGVAAYDEQSLNFSNCLFFRPQLYFWDQSDNPNLTFENCTFYGGIMVYGRQTYFSPSVVTIKNTTFDGTAFPLGDNLNSNTNDTVIDYNAYNTNNLSWQGYSYPYGPCYGTLQTVGSHSIYVTNYNWESSWFGNYYLPTNSTLLNTGSTNANLLGLFHYTVTTNQVVEGTNIVSIGYHYVATDTNGVPLDSNGDGIPDYLEDPPGNGLPYNGTNWALAILVQPTNELVNAGTSPTISVTAQGIPPLVYQWYFDSNLLAGATSATLTFSDVTTNSTGTYFVVVTNYVPVPTYSGFLTSSVATLTVVPPPTVVITNPANNTVVATNAANITIQATASDPVGTISQVQFFEGTTNLGTVTNPPYTNIWTNVPPGNYALTAVATDNGLSTTSAVVNITISPVFETNTMTLWLKADAITGLANNAPISTWYDSSGWGNNVAAPSYTTYNLTYSDPFYVTNAINGYPTVYYNPTNAAPYGPAYFNSSENLITTNVGNFMNTATGVEALVVLQVKEDPAYYTNLNSGGPGLYAQGCWFDSANNNPPDESYPSTDGSVQDDFGANNIYYLGVPAQPLTQYHIYEVTSQSNIWSAWINEVLLYQANTNTFGLWYQFETANQEGAFGGDIPEVLIFNRGLTLNERATVNTYLNGKYGLVPSIPATPSNLVATAISPTQIGLTWSEPLNGGATQTSIERSTSSSSGFTTIAQVADALSYVDANLASGTTYYYQVRAINVNTWSPYSNQTNATTLASGADIPFADLILWLKADSGLAQIGTNTPVSSWSDKSGNGNNVIQSSANLNTPTATHRPTWILGTISGFPVLHYTSATNQALFTYNPINGTNSSTSVEAFAVVRATTASPTNTGGLWYYSALNNRPNEQYPSTNGISDDFGSKVLHSFTNTVALTNYNVYEVVSQSTNWAAWINGALQFQTNVNAVEFGGQFNIGNENFGGDIAEILVFNQSLTTAQRTTIVTNYLFQKYSITH